MSIKSSLLQLSVWSNFEIANMDFWRGEAYSKFFEYLDETGGFYYDVCTPVHILSSANNAKSVM